jgi:hypothetical protein
MSSMACAVENETTHAALGFTDSLHGALLDPGFYIRSDTLSYRSTDLKDGNGNSATAHFGAVLAPFGVPPGTPGTTGPVRLKAYGTYEQLTLFEQTTTVIPVLNAHWGFGATFLYGSEHVELNAQVPIFAAFGQPTLRDLGSGKVSALGDTAVFPLYLGWKLNDLWSLTANPLNFYLKTGSYDVRNAQNLGRNYNSWAPQVSVTYFDMGSGREGSAQLNYLKNSRNDATDYKSGDEFFVSYGVYQWLPLPDKNNAWKVGLSGYLYRQLTDDKRGNVSVYSAQDTQPNIFGNGVGNRGQVAAIGPSLEFYFPAKSPKWIIDVHWDHEFRAKNLPQADRLWLKVAYRFGAGDQATATSSGLPRPGIQSSAGS